MTNFDPNNPDIHHLMSLTWLLHHWRITIPTLVGTIVSLEVAQDRWGNDGKAIVQVGIAFLLGAAFLHQRRAERKKAAAEDE